MIAESITKAKGALLGWIQFWKSHSICQAPSDKRMKGEWNGKLTEGPKRDSEDEKGDGVGDAGPAEEVAGGDAQHQRHPNEEHRVVRLRNTIAPHSPPFPYSLSLPCASPMEWKGMDRFQEQDSSSLYFGLV